MKTKNACPVIAFLLIALIPCVGRAQQQPPPSGHCGDPKSASPSETNDVLDLTERSTDAIEHATDKLEGQVDSIDFDSQAVQNWLSQQQLPDLPLVNEDKTINNIAKLTAALIERAEKSLKEAAKNALNATESALKTSFETAIQSLLPTGDFSADAAWEEKCCDTTGYWSNPSVIKSGVTSKKGKAGFNVQVDIGGGLGVEAETKATIEFEVSLELALTGWANARFWPSAKNADDNSNHTGCSVTVKALPEWAATYGATQKAGVMLIVTLGSETKLENDPKLKEVETTLSIPPKKP